MLFFFEPIITKHLEHNFLPLHDQFEPIQLCISWASTHLRAAFLILQQGSISALIGWLVGLMGLQSGWAEVMFC